MKPLRFCNVGEIFFRLDTGSATAVEQARTNGLLTGEMARLVRFYGVNKDSEQLANITIAVSRGEVKQPSPFMFE